MLPTLGEVVERPQLLFFYDKMMSLQFWDMYLVVFNVFGQHFAIQLRTAAMKMNSGQRGCGVRTCGLFH
jgi:hypothetical protein